MRTFLLTFACLRDRFGFSQDGRVSNPYRFSHLQGQLLLCLVLDVFLSLSEPGLLRHGADGLFIGTKLCKHKFVAELALTRSNVYLLSLYKDQDYHGL